MFREPAFAERGLAPDAPPPPARRLGALRRMVPLLLPYRRQALIALVALVVAAATVLGVGAGLSALVDRGFSEGHEGLLTEAMLGMAAIILVLAAATYARFYMVSWIGERVVTDLRRAVFSHLLRLDPGFYETSRTGGLVSRLTTDTTLLQVVVGTSASIALRNLLLLIGGLVLLMVTSVKLTLMVVVVVPLVLLPVIAYGRRVRALSRRAQDRVADVGSLIEETLAGIRTVQAFTREPERDHLFAAAAEEAFSVAVTRIRARAALTAAAIVLAFGAVGAILYVGGLDVMAGRMSAGDLAGFVFYAIIVAGAVGALSEVAGDLQRAAGATERLFELLDTQPAITAPAAPVPLAEPPVGRVTFDGVAFRYPAHPDRPALDGVSFSLEPGETVALVGPSGAGKTTILSLLLRFYDPDAGIIRVDGTEIRHADPRALRQRLGLVPQDPVIFAASAAENIRFGRPEADQAALEAAAEAAHALEFIRALPQGWDSFLGERGVRLSGGQRQRIAIARAILRDPAILLLDEATSALDAESEQVVQSALERLMRGRTTLVIAHRLATVQRADRILVLEAGRIVAAGRHDQLVREGGLYARLAQLQFGRVAA